MNNVIERNGKNMSFVGMHIMNDGIIAFADSKASIKYDNGIIKEDINRGLICKIFKNNKFVFVTYGNNEIFSSENKMNIEDYIEQNLEESMDYEKFFMDLNSAIQNNQAKYNDGEYNFIIGSKNNNKYFLEKCKIKQNEPIEFYDKTYEKQIYTGGDIFYTNLYSRQNFYYDVDIDEYAQIIKTFIESLVKAKDSLDKYHYNPVGLPVQIEIFQ